MVVINRGWWNWKLRSTKTVEAFLLLLLLWGQPVRFVLKIVHVIVCMFLVEKTANPNSQNSDIWLENASDCRQFGGRVWGVSMFLDLRFLEELLSLLSANSWAQSRWITGCELLFLTEIVHIWCLTNFDPPDTWYAPPPPPYLPFEIVTMTSEEMGATGWLRKGGQGFVTHTAPRCWKGPTQ